ncbi:hypothetical protein [Streptomyces sp. NPDC058678]|uniref:hypothetical protein n=1 Tax=Streptomyces sp. NPDC058678 TaxID=3346595 RepID=UPI00365CE1D3
MPLRTAPAGRDRHNLLGDAACLLPTQDTRAARPARRSTTRERLMLHLADRVAQAVQRTADDGTNDAVQTREAGRPPDPDLPGAPPTTPQTLATRPARHS